MEATARCLAARGVPNLAARRGAEFRRSRRADRGHASHPGRGEALDLGAALPARAQLLHAAAGPRGAAARDLYRLADASHARRHHGRRAFRRPRHHRHHGAELRLCGLGQRADHRRAVLRAQSGGAGHRDRGGRSDRQTGAQEQGDDRTRRDRLRRHLLLGCSVSHHRIRRGASSALSRPRWVSPPFKPRRGTAAARKDRAVVDSLLGEEHAGTRPPDGRTCAWAFPPFGSRSGSFRSSRSSPRSAAPMCSARSRSSSARWRS